MKQRFRSTAYCLYWKNKPNKGYSYAVSLVTTVISTVYVESGPRGSVTFDSPASMAGCKICSPLILTVKCRMCRLTFVTTHVLMQWTRRSLITVFSLCQLLSVTIANSNDRFTNRCPTYHDYRSFSLLHPHTLRPIDNYIEYSLDFLRPFKTAEAYEAIDWLADLPQRTSPQAGRQ